MIVEMLIGTLVPVGAEAVKQLVGKWTGGVKPATIDDQIKLDQNEIARMEALSRLDAPIGEPSQWVVDLRASARYIGALVVIATGIASMFLPEIDTAVRLVAFEAANIAFGFLFGTRIVNGWKR